MAIFFAIMNKKQNNQDLNIFQHMHEYYESSLFFKKNANIYQYKTKNCVLFVADWLNGVEVISQNNTYTLVQGLYNKKISDHLHNCFKNNTKIDFRKVNMPCTAVSISEEQIQCYSSLSGIEHCYFFENENYIAFSNRIGTFSLIQNLTVDYNALTKLILKAHMIDQSTCYEQVKKLQPGQRIQLKYGEKINVSAPPYKEIADEKGSIIEYLKIFDNTVEEYYDYMTSKSKKILNLSGGKDSRAILAMIDFLGGLDENLFLSTSGALYSPEVLSAKNLFEILKETKIHWSNKHSFYQKNSDITKNIAKSWVSNEGLLGFFAMDTLEMSNAIVFGGHEVAFKYRENKLNKDRYHNNLMGYLDSNDLLLCEYKNSLLKTYIEETVSPALADIPLEKYFAYHDAFLRVPYTPAGVTSSMHTISSKFINPLMDFNFTRLLLISGQQYIDNQFFLYYLTSKSPHEIASLPFCNDNWPEGLLNLAIKHNLKTDSLRNKSIPYYFDKHLPEHKHRTDYMSKNIVLDTIKNLLPSYIDEFGHYFPMLDTKKILAESAKRTSDIPPTLIPCLSAFISACITIENKQEYFRLNSVDAVHKNITSRIKDKIKADNSEIFYINRLTCYSESIAALIQEKRDSIIKVGEDRDFKMLSAAIKLEKKPWVKAVKIPNNTKEICIKGRIVRHPDLKKKLPVLLAIFSDNKNIQFSGCVYNDNLKLYCISVLKRDGEEMYNISFPISNSLKSLEFHIMSFGETYMIGEPEFKFL